MLGLKAAYDITGDECLVTFFTAQSCIPLQHVTWMELIRVGEEPVFTFREK